MDVNEPINQTLPKTVDEAVERLVAELGRYDLKEILAKTRDEMIDYHFSSGMQIRSVFGLWGRNPELLRSCGKLHPDDASGVILKALWDRLRAD